MGEKRGKERKGERDMKREREGEAETYLTLEHSSGRREPSTGIVCVVLIQKIGRIVTKSFRLVQICFLFEIAS